MTAVSLFWVINIAAVMIKRLCPAFALQRLTQKPRETKSPNEILIELRPHALRWA